ncbi:hypothetical protein B0H14DRAFT_1578379 [Mycena olivaceomarginata]|nr:hypothetical protein B0H14DRAFT_1578379 [Mycena olivaceomarginata]
MEPSASTITNALQHQHQHHSWDNNNTAFQNAAQRAPTSLVDIHLSLVDGTRPRRTASAHAPISRSRPELGPSLSCAHHCRLTLHSRAARDTIGRGGARSPLKSNGYGNRGAHSSIHPVARAPYALICGGGTTSWSARRGCGPRGEKGISGNGCGPRERRSVGVERVRVGEARG